MEQVYPSEEKVNLIRTMRQWAANHKLKEDLSHSLSAFIHTDTNETNNTKAKAKTIPRRHAYPSGQGPIRYLPHQDRALDLNTHTTSVWVWWRYPAPVFKYILLSKRVT